MSQQTDISADSNLPIVAQDVQKKPRVLWLHTQPEHYFNCMMDDLARGAGYELPGQRSLSAGESQSSPRSTPEYEYIAAFSCRGPNLYKDNDAPRVAHTVFLRPRPGRKARPAAFRERYHVDWREDLFPLKFDAAIVSGYASRTHREVIAECRRRGIPVALWSDSNLRSQRGDSCKARLRRRLKKAYLRTIFCAVDLQLTANSRGVAYWRYYGEPKDRIVLCPYYSDYARIDQAKLRPRADVLAQFGLSSTDRIFFSAARLVPAKGLDLMIRAFREGGFAHQGWRYVIAGMGPMESELKQLAGDSLGKSIFLVGFQQPQNNLALMAHADLFVLPSRYEPHGIVVAEALAAGTPVVASDIVGAAADLIENGVSGMIFRSNDPADLLKKLHETVAPDRLAALRRGARPAFEAWYAKTSPLRVVPEIVHRMLAQRNSLIETL